MRTHRDTLAALGCLAVVVAIAGCGEAGVGDPAGGAQGSKASAHGTGGASAPYVAAAGVGSGGAAGGAGSSPAGATGASAAGGVAHEVADPEEAKSFPVAGTIHHKAATTPAKAGEAAIAPGAPSDAEVKAELNQMHAAQQSAQKTEQNVLKPVPGGESIGGNGTLPIPTGVPEVIQKVVAGANAITDFPYVYGGGHASFVDNAYDCSGSVSYALAAGGLLSAPETSGELESWGAPGAGRYITVFANAGHTYMYVDGILYDTAGRSGTYASRWQVGGTDNEGYVVRHYPGL
jgi:cell wall-associated NlpC family hydrolase